MNINQFKENLSVTKLIDLHYVTGTIISFYIYLFGNKCAHIMWDDNSPLASEQLLSSLHLLKE